MKIVTTYIRFVFPFWAFQWLLLVLGYGPDKDRMWIWYIVVAAFNLAALAVAYAIGSSS